MQNQMTNITGIAGLALIFILAAVHQSNFRWVAGVFAIQIILIIRNLLGEVTHKTEIIMMLAGFCFTLLTILFLIY
jgi:hypothetical protein